MLFIIPQCNQIGYNFSELFLPASRSWLELRLVFWSFAALTLAKRIQMFRLPSSRPNRRYPVPFCTCSYPSYSLQDPANILRHMSTVICHVASVCVTLSVLLFLGRQLWGGVLGVGVANRNIILGMSLNNTSGTCSRCYRRPCDMSQRLVSCRFAFDVVNY